MQKVTLPPFEKWSPSFKKTFFERLGAWNSIKSEDDMRFAKEINLVVKNDMYSIEIQWHTDIIEVLKKDLPRSIKSKLTSS